MARCTTAQATRLLAPRSFDVVVVERHVFDFQAARESVVFFLVHLAYATYCGAASDGGVGGLASCQGGRSMCSQRSVSACLCASFAASRLPVVVSLPDLLPLQVAANYAYFCFYVYFCFTFSSIHANCRAPFEPWFWARVLWSSGPASTSGVESFAAQFTTRALVLWDSGALGLRLGLGARVLRGSGSAWKFGVGSFGARCRP